MSFEWAELLCAFGRYSSSPICWWWTIIMPWLEPDPILFFTNGNIWMQNSFWFLGTLIIYNVSLPKYFVALFFKYFSLSPVSLHTHCQQGYKRNASDQMYQGILDLMVWRFGKHICFLSCRRGNEQIDTTLMRVISICSSNSQQERIRLSKKTLSFSFKLTQGATWVSLLCHPDGGWEH